jgi:hypothetical protein
MKKITLIFAVLCLMGMTAMAQDNQNGSRRGKMDPTTMIARLDEGMAKNLTGLTDEQKTKIHVINTDFVTGMQKNRPQMKEGERPSQEDMQAMRTKMEEIRKVYKASLKSVLSDSQYAEYEKYEKTQYQRGGQNGTSDDHGGQKGEQGETPQSHPND